MDIPYTIVVCIITNGNAVQPNKIYCCLVEVPRDSTNPANYAVRVAGEYFNLHEDEYTVDFTRILDNYNKDIYFGDTIELEKQR